MNKRFIFISSKWVTILFCQIQNLNQGILYVFMKNFILFCNRKIPDLCPLNDSQTFLIIVNKSLPNYFINQNLNY